jgi:hypothetical protein
MKIKIPAQAKLERGTLDLAWTGQGGSGSVRLVASVCTQEIPRPAGENAGLRDDAGGAHTLKIFKLSHNRQGGNLAKLMQSEGHS